MIVMPAVLLCSDVPHRIKSADSAERHVMIQ